MDILTTGASAGLPGTSTRAGPTTRRRRGLAAPLALPAAFMSLLMIGALAAGTSGRVGPAWVLILAAVIVGAGSAVAETAVTPVLGAIGWLTVTGFSGRPYAQLQMTGPVALRAGIVMACCSLGGAAAGALVRRLASSFTLWIVEVPEDRWPAAVPPDLPIQGARSVPAATGQADSVRRPRAADQPALAGARQRHRWARRLAPVASLSRGIGSQRLVAGVILVAGLPLLTAALVAAQHWLSLADDLLIYLVAVVAVAVVGGFWPAVLAAVSSSLLLNWYFTRPVHTLTIADPQNLLALLLFVTVAVIVSSVVHLAAHRAAQAARSSEEATELLALAQTVLGGADTPAAVLDHLTATEGGRADLLELVAGQWVRAATSGTAPAGSATVRVQPRPGLVLLVSAQSRPVTARLLDGFAAQAAAALDRDRLRTQAAQAEALGEGNRMRTALLAAVSHDLRTPLASIKASVSTLRQTDVEWTAADQAALLATIEQGADRLDALIGNLLDMSRLSTGSLQPFLRPTAIDEVAPVALRGLDVGGRDVAGADAVVRLAVPDGLPLIRTDPGLLERVLANLFANALAYSPPGHPPSLCARQDDRSVVLDVIDHGPGVPDAFKSRMFEPFERLDERAGGTGVGLGLAVVKGFLDAMGGSVAAQDTPGGGLTIRVTLPVSDATGAGAQARTWADP